LRQGVGTKWRSHTLNNNTISIGCGDLLGEGNSGGLSGVSTTSGGTGGTGGGGGNTSVPEPSTFGMLLAGLLALGLLTLRKLQAGR
jgi:hypothetical protein